MFMGLEKDEKKSLEYEIISNDVRLKISRLFRQYVRTGNSDESIIFMNRIINIARRVEGKIVYVLESDGCNHFQPGEYAWHLGELEAITQRQTTCELVETICDLLAENILSVDMINDFFASANVGVFFDLGGMGSSVTIIDSKDIPDEESAEQHPNIRKLVERMEILLNNNDYTGVLATSSSIFETLAKIVINEPKLENKTLGKIMNAYRQRSKLLAPILDMIENTYIKRGQEPIAGHGSTQLPNIQKDEAIMLSEMTKAVIRIERKLNI